MKIILPKRVVSEDELRRVPLFFLAGPIRGGGNWQERCCNLLAGEMGRREFFVAVPCRWSESNALFRFSVGEIIEGHYSSQTSWERDHLELAACASEERMGGIIFFLPEESKEFPRTGGGPYAQDTYGELGEWRAECKHRKKLRLAIGAEKGFPGLGTIKKNFQLALGVDPEAFFCSTLEETVKRAVSCLQ